MMESSEKKADTLPLFKMPANQLGDKDIRIHLFGTLELENRWDKITETTDQQSVLFTLLKYLLISPQRKAEYEELLMPVWKIRRVTQQLKGAVRVQIHRLRELLAPLKLNGTDGLLTYSGGKFALNSCYTLLFDTEVFTDLMRQLDGHPAKDPLGITLSVEALKIYRGPLLGNTKNVPWLAGLRNYYHREFFRLVQGTIERMRVLNREDPLAILCHRALTLAPNNEVLQKKIISYLADRKQLQDLMQYIFQLSRSDKAEWLKISGESGGESDAWRILMEPQAENDVTVYVRLFGSLEIRNAFGRVTECSARKKASFLLIKYLLLKSERKADLENLEKDIWMDSGEEEEKKTKCAGRLKRSREQLAPLKLDSREGLLQYKKGMYSLRSTNPIQRDVDVFAALIKKIEQCPVQNPNGLKYCGEALELYRGPLLEDTKDAAWLTEKRNYYHETFCHLVKETLLRIKTQRDDRVLALLCQRTAAVIPEDEAFHKDLLRYLLEQRQATVLAPYLSRLMHSGKATWLSSYGAEKEMLQEKNVSRSGKPEQEAEPGQEGSHPASSVKSTAPLADLDKDVQLPAEISLDARQDSAQDAEDEHVVHVKLFGEVELKNKWAPIVENKARLPRPFQLIKYLLLKPDSQADLEELIMHIWPESKEPEDSENAARVRLNRAREFLKPMHLNGKNGLICYRNGRYYLNPEYILKKDIDKFQELMKQIGLCSMEDPTGLDLCTAALEVYRGPLMEYTEEAPWFSAQKHEFHIQFCSLAWNTLQRAKALGNDNALPLLCRRTAAMIAREDVLHTEIIHYLKERHLDLVLEQYLSQLRCFGKNVWLD